MGGGSIFYIILPIYLIIGIPIVTGILMKMYWRIMGKSQQIIDGKPYYQEPFPFVVSLALSLIILSGIGYLLLLLFERIYPADIV
jgi:hypothetical protein